MHTGAQKGTEIQIQLTRKVTPKRPNRLKPVRGTGSTATLPSRVALGHDVSHTSAHVPEMKPEQKQEQAVTPLREIAPKQEQGEDFGLGL